MFGLRASRLLIVGLLGLLLVSCDDDDDSRCPVCPHWSHREPTLENVWPNADSAAWTYGIEQRQWPDSAGPVVYENEEDVPPAPTIGEIQGSLWVEDVGDDVETDQGMYRLQFDGRMTTESGAEAQRLRATLYSQTYENPPPSSGSPYTAFYGRLARMRPDLRAALAAKGLIGPEAGGGPSRNPGTPFTKGEIEAAFFYLHGYAWEKTADQIIGFGDVDTLPAWKYLEADLDPGHEFTIQLVPGLTDDVFLHARILPRRSAATEAGRFTNCVECAYLIDYGVSQATNEDGSALGYFRSWDYASIVYAPGVGPVMSYQRVPPFPSLPNSPAPSVSTDYRISLVGTNLPWRNP
jgi:hypothetical protein